MEPPSLPFFIPNVYQGLATAHGIARVTSVGLTLEFEVKDAFVGALKTGIRAVHIHLDDFHDFELRAGWFSTRLLIRTRTMAPLRDVPGSQVGGILLGIKRQDRKVAKAIATALTLRLSERELERLGRAGDVVTRSV